MRLARLLLKEQASVTINGRSQEKVDKAVQKLQQQVPGADVKGIAADFLKEDEVQNIIRQLPEIDLSKMAVKKRTPVETRVRLD